MAFDDRGGYGGGDRPQRQTFQGDWKCAECGTEIKELPFQPDPSRIDQLRCRNCYRPKKRFNRDRY